MKYPNISYFGYFFNPQEIISKISTCKVGCEMELALKLFYNLPSIWSIPHFGPDLCLEDYSVVRGFNDNFTHLCFC
jgi:hypothetical protein